MSDERVEADAVLNRIVTTTSTWSFEESVQRILDVIASRGLTVFDVIDHRQAARTAAMDLRPTTVILFGSPSVGTPLMETLPVLALELPLRILVWQERDQTRFSHLEPAASTDLVGPGTPIEAVLATPASIVAAASA